MKNLILILLLCSCGLTKDLDEYEKQPAMLTFITRENRFNWVEREYKWTTMKKQTWEFLDNHYKIIEYVDTTNREEIGIIALKDRRR